MLVIRRGRGESLRIGDDIEIEVLDVGGSQVKLGIRAPREIPVVRREIAVTAETNRAASQGSPMEALEALAARLARSRPYKA